MTGYVPDPNDATNPTDAISAETAAPEFRALKAKVNGMILASGTKIPVRQTVLSGVPDANGNAAFLANGSTALCCKLLATAMAFIYTVASGYNNAGGVDYTGTFGADMDNYWTAIPANNLSFLSLDINTTTGAATPTQTLIPPWYSNQYDSSRANLLHFDGANLSTTFTDDYGSPWTAGGSAKLQTNVFKFGVSALGGAGTNNALNGSTDYITTSNIHTFGSGSWCVEAWVQPSALPSNGVKAVIASMYNVSNFGFDLCIYNAAGTIKFTYDISSNGSSNNVASLVQGTTTPVVGTWYHVALTYDSVAGTYRLYVNGTQEASTASALIVSGGTALVIGANNAGGAGWFNGYIDEFRVSPYCPYPGGTAFAVATAEFAPAGDWFDTTNMVMYSISAAGPMFTKVTRLYVGEVTTNGVACTTESAYAFKGRVEFPWTYPVPAAGTVIPGVHNMGLEGHNIEVEAYLRNISGNEAGYTGGQIVEWITWIGQVSFPAGISTQRGRIKFTFAVANSDAIQLLNIATGAAVNGTVANWEYKFIFQRRF